MVVVQYTGRRLSSVLALRWNDVDFERETIAWRAEADKRRKTWLAPMPRTVTTVLRAYRDRRPHPNSPFVFPSPVDDGRPVDKDRADTMLERAYRLASITRPPGGLWHPFRRRWATTGKHFPLKDVAQAGGWDDVRTLLVCYQQPDADTMCRVVDFIPSGDSGSVTYTQTYTQRAAG